MKKDTKFSIVLFLIFIIYFVPSSILRNLIGEEVSIFFNSVMFGIIIICFFTYFSYLIIRSDKLTKNQKICLLLFLIIIGLVDLISIYVLTVSYSTIYAVNFGIFNSISLGIFCMISAIIFSSKKSSNG
jgi:hypothetical protein